MLRNKHKSFLKKKYMQLNRLGHNTFRKSVREFLMKWFFQHFEIFASSSRVLEIEMANKITYMIKSH